MCDKIISRLKFAVVLVAAVLVPLPALAQLQYYYHPQYGYYYYPTPPQPTPYPRDERETRPQPRKQIKKPKASPTPDPDYPAIVLPEGEGQLLTWSFKNSFPTVARKAGTSAARLLELNRLTYDDLRAGQVIRLPTTGTETIWAESDEMSREIWRGPRGLKRIALTFDAGADFDHAYELLENLQQANAPATFFITGPFAEKHQDFVRAIAEAGMPVHNHSWSHPEFTGLSRDEMVTELQRTDDVLSELTGKSTKPYWRPPFGDRDQRVLEITAEEGYRSIYWTVDSLDSVGHPKDRDAVLRRVLYPPKSDGNPERFLDGAIVLMHVGKKGTAEAIPELVRSLRDHDFELVTIEDLLKP